MSTENDGDAATPAAGPDPTQSAAPPGHRADSQTPESSAAPAARPQEDDFALPEPGARADGAGRTGGERTGGDAYAAFDAAFDEPRDSAPRAAAPRDEVPSSGVVGEDTAVLKRLGPSGAGGEPAANGDLGEGGTTQLRAVPADAAPRPVAGAGAGRQDAPTTGLPRVDPERPEPAGPPLTEVDPAAATAPPVPTVADPAVGSAQPPPDMTKQQPEVTPDVTTVSAAEGHTGQWGGAPGGGQQGGGQQGGAGTPPPAGGYGAGPGGAAGAGGAGAPGGGGPQSPWGTPPPPPPSGPGGRRAPGVLIAAVLAAALFAGGIGGGIGFWAADRDSSGSTTVSSDDSGSDSASSEELNRSPKSVAGIADKALPSVVTIEAAGEGGGSTGTGFVYDEQGHILTNNHVVASAADGGKMTATFSDGKSYAAEIVGRAEGYDIAVIKLKNAGDRELDPLPLGNSDKMKVGDATIAIGAPFGLSGTVTTGIVSAQDRPVAAGGSEGSDASYMNALQTDASINPGNSGGPLLDGKGAVIGVNSAIRSGSGGLGESQSGSVGLGFAIPINQAKRVAGQLIETGVPVYPAIGVRVQMGEQSTGGAEIAKSVSNGEPVTEGGPADKAGLEPGDVITEFDGRAIDSGPTLIATIWTHKPDETVKVTYKRGGQEKTTELTLGSKKGD